MVSFAAWVLCIAYTYKGDLSRALEYGEMAVHKAPTIADQVWAQNFYACALCRAGKVEQAIEILANLIPVYRKTNFVPGEPATLFLVEGYMQAGDYDKAKPTLDDLMEIAKRCEMRFILGMDMIPGKLLKQYEGRPEFDESLFKKVIKRNPLSEP